MAAFALCDACAAEYHDPADRRFHAQPLACADCGPRLWFERRPGGVVDGTDAALAAAQRALARGRRSSPSRASAATTWPATPRRDAAVGRAAPPQGAGPTSRSPSWSATSTWPAGWPHIDADEAAAAAAPAAPDRAARRRAPDAPLSPLVAPGNPHDRASAAVHAAAPPAVPARCPGSRGAGARRAGDDQRQPHRRAHLLRRRRRPRGGWAGIADALADPRPAHPRALRRLGGPGGRRRGAADPPVPRLRPAARAPARSRWPRCWRSAAS